MMSLFTSFDLHFYPLSFLVIFVLILTYSSVTHKLGYGASTPNLATIFLNKFFSTLKIKSANKISFLILNSFMMSFLAMNFLGVLPFNFALTSQVSTVMLVSLLIWSSFILFSSIWAARGLLSHCIPEGSPIYLSWFLFGVEIVSNLIRPLTLMVRLVANILAGHLLMILLASLVSNYVLASPFYLILNLVEMFVALIQSYIFVTMITLYYAEVV